jgi:hypothetical protein
MRWKPLSPESRLSNESLKRYIVAEAPSPTCRSARQTDMTSDFNCSKPFRARDGARAGIRSRAHSSRRKSIFCRNLRWVEVLIHWFLAQRPPEGLRDHRMLRQL